MVALEMNRSKNVKRNIMISIVLKFIGIVLSFLLLPLTVNYLTEVEYGIWVTLFSVMNWINMLDMGIGLGFRNKLAEAVAANNQEEVKIYMSTGFFSIASIGLVMMILFLVSIQFVNMQVVFNTIEIDEKVLYKAVLFTGIFVILTFVTSVINQIYYAYQKAALTGAVQITYNFIMLLLIYGLTLLSRHNILYFVFAFGIASVLSKTVFILQFFSKRIQLIPRFRYAKWSRFINITNLGVRFFVIQLTCIITFSSSNILITQFLGPEYVRDYDIVFKIFSIITMAHSLICAPLWNAYTEAYVKKDFTWIATTLNKMKKLMIFIVSGTIVLSLLLNFIIKIWISNNIVISIGLNCFMALYAVISCWSNTWATFLNGIGKINIQMYSTMFSAILILVLSFPLMRMLQSAGMILAIDIGLGTTSMILYFQVCRLCKNQIGREHIE